MRSPKVYWRWFRWQIVKDGWEPTDTGWVLTIGIIWLVSWMAYPIREGQPQSKLTEFLTLRSSEMGDTLAGIFSALAFVWIIVTVFMQSRELREQRMEFKQQRLATQEMARAMAAQATVFEDEQKFREESRHKAVFEETLVMLVAQMRVLQLPLWKIMEVPKPDGFEVMKAQLEGMEVSDIPPKPAVEVIIRAILDIDELPQEIIFSASSVKISHLADKLAQVKNGDFVEKPLRSEFLALTSIIDGLDRLKDKLAEDQVIRFFNLRLHTLNQRLKELLTMDVWNDHSDEKIPQ